MKTGGHIYPSYSCFLNKTMLFKIDKISDLEIIRLDLLMLSLST